MLSCILTFIAASRAFFNSSAVVTLSSVSSGSFSIYLFKISTSSSLPGSPTVSFMMKRSSSASGSEKVPALSIGFCVATTKKGASSFKVSPSIVTCLSSIHSSRPACVRGVALFISSARSILVNTGPFLNTKSFSLRLNTLIPVISLGRRSGVNCILEKPILSDFAKDLASLVFPVPGTSSISTCPSARSAVSRYFMTASLPTITFPIFSVILSLKTCPSEPISFPQSFSIYDIALLSVFSFGMSLVILVLIIIHAFIGYMHVLTYVKLCIVKAEAYGKAYVIVFADIS